MGPTEHARANSCCGSLEQAALNELVAQLVEQRPFKAWVVGSIPTELTTQAATSLPTNSITSSDSTTARRKPAGWSCAAILGDRRCAV
jgi:hypothetical protein